MKSKKRTTKRRILIVDQNPSIHQDFQSMLSPAHLRTLPDSQEMEPVEFDLVHASNERDALKAISEAVIQSRPFAVAFVDTRITAEWRGIEIIDHIWSADPRIQMVACTTYAEFEWESIAQRLGCSDNLLILKKPLIQGEVRQLALALTNKWSLARASELHVDQLEQMVIARTADLQATLEFQRHTHKMEAVGHLASGIAHEFKNLLTVIQGYTDIELARTPENTDISTSLHHIARAAARADSVTKQLLAFSDTRPLELLPLDLNERIASLEPILRPMLGATIDLHFDFPVSLPEVCADPSIIDQAIINLVLNARNAMPNGGKVAIQTAIETIPSERIPSKNRSANPGRYIRTTVTDSGIGMDPATTELLFEPFFPTKDGGSQSGLGLAIVRSIIEKHQGWVSVSTALNAGSSFHLFLPILENLLPTPAKTSPTPHLQGTGTVLIVEDEESVGQLISYIFSNHGFNVLNALDGHQALRLWQENSDKITLLFTDMVMPGGISGYELAQKILADQPDLPVIYSSGYSKDILSKNINFQEGFNYLPKPYRPAQLSAIISSVMARSLAPHTNPPKFRQVFRQT